MGKLKAVSSRLNVLKPALGMLVPIERTETQERTLFAPWRSWYNTARWRALRIRIFTRDLFTCQWPGCGRIEGNTSQLVADHCTPHRGEERLFWDERNLQTLCKPCHDGAKQRAERIDVRA